MDEEDDGDEVYFESLANYFEGLYQELLISGDTKNIYRRMMRHECE